ncbi:phage tail protein, partial [Mannheimia haemolytica]|nr:phage tail protein [Mannheimia haemolytica]
MDTFNFQPNWGLNVQRKPEVMKIAFGDGYEQVAPKGLNHNLRTYSAVFTGTEARIKQIQPNWGLNVQRKPEVMKIAFGDGYEQVAPKGLNHNLRTYSAVFTGTEARIKQI